MCTKIIIIFGIQRVVTLTVGDILINSILVWQFTCIAYFYFCMNFWINLSSLINYWTGNKPLLIGNPCFGKYAEREIVDLTESSHLQKKSSIFLPILRTHGVTLIIGTFKDTLTCSSCFYHLYLYTCVTGWHLTPLIWKWSGIKSVVTPPPWFLDQFSL